MNIYQCRICGGNLRPDGNTAVCESCGNVSPLPSVEAGIYNRANYYRLNQRFDEALALFRQMNESQDAECHFNMMLCKYGVEYVMGPDGVRRPTCHSASYDSVLEDEDYLKAVALAPSAEAYRAEAEAIEEIRKGILLQARDGKKYEVFICYKETIEGTEDRAPDSLIAQEIYEELMRRGHSVFFSRKTLEKEAGEKYEPLIFSALHSARVMVVVGTRAAHFNSPWVRNEWSRFRRQMEKDSAKALIPVFRDISPYDIPGELVRGIQGVNAGNIGFYNDVADAVDRIVGSKGRTAAVDLDGLTRAGEHWLKNGDFNEARNHFLRVLDVDGTRHEAWWGLLRASTMDFSDTDRDPSEIFRPDELEYYQNAYRLCADDRRKAEFDKAIAAFKAAIREYREQAESRASDEHLNAFIKRLQAEDMRLVIISEGNEEVVSLLEAIGEQKSGELLELIRRHNSEAEAYKRGKAEYEAAWSNLEGYMEAEAQKDEHLMALRRRKDELRNNLMKKTASYSKIFLSDVLIHIFAVLSYLSLLDSGFSFRSAAIRDFETPMVMLGYFIPYTIAFIGREGDISNSFELLFGGKRYIRTSIAFFSGLLGFYIIMFLSSLLDEVIQEMVGTDLSRIMLIAFWFLLLAFFIIASVKTIILWARDFGKQKAIKSLRKEFNSFLNDALIPAYAGKLNALNEKYANILSPEELRDRPQYTKEFDDMITASGYIPDLDRFVMLGFSKKDEEVDA